MKFTILFIVSIGEYFHVSLIFSFKNVKLQKKSLLILLNLQYESQDNEEWGKFQRTT